MDDNKGSSAVASITFLSVSVLSVNVFSILLRGGLPWLHCQGGFQEGEQIVLANISKKLMFIYVNVLYVEVQGKY